MTYRVFTRNAWKENPDYPNGLEPDSKARKHTIAKGILYLGIARGVAEGYNSRHKPGRLHRRAEFEEENPIN